MVPLLGGGSILTHNVLPFEIVAGVPARHLGWRFGENIRNRLNEIKWWNFPEEVIKEHLDLFDGEVTPELLEKLEYISKTII